MPERLIGPSEVSARLAKLRGALVGAIGEDMVVNAVEVVAEQARGGNLRACGMLLGLVNAPSATTIEHNTTNQTAIFVTGPGAELCRKLAAHLLAQHGTLSVNSLSVQLELDAGAVRELMENHPWFLIPRIDEFSLAPEGRRAIT